MEARRGATYELSGGATEHAPKLIMGATYFYRGNPEFLRDYFNWKNIAYPSTEQELRNMEFDVRATVGGPEGQGVTVQVKEGSHAHGDILSLSLEQFNKYFDVEPDPLVGTVGRFKKKIKRVIH